MSALIFEALRVRSYRVVALGNAVSMLGVWMQKVTSGWLAWELTHSTTWLGLVTAADLVPAVLLSALSGTLADRFDKLTLMRFAQAAAVAQSLLLAVLVLTDTITIGALFGLSLALGVANSVDQPARLSMLRDLVPPVLLPSAITFNALSFNLARFVGPLLAGLTLSAGGAGLSFLAAGLALALFLAALLSIRSEAVGPEAQAGSFLSGATEGFRYLLQSRLLRDTMLVQVTFGMTIGGLNQVLPALADRTYGRGVDGFVELLLASAFGSVASGITLLSLSSKRLALFPIPVCMLLSGAALFGLAVAPSYWMAVLLIFVAAFAMTQAGVQIQSTVNRVASPGMLGRVMGSYSAIVRGGPALGGFLLGLFATWVAFPALFLVAALLMAGVALLKWRAFPTEQNG
ncbi:MFS transporter [Pseudoroseicyclus sp. H15]